MYFIHISTIKKHKIVCACVRIEYHDHDRRLFFFFGITMYPKVSMEMYVKWLCIIVCIGIHLRLYRKRRPEIKQAERGLSNK